MTFDVWIWHDGFTFGNSKLDGILVTKVGGTLTKVGTGYQGGYHAFQGNPIGNPPLGGLICVCVCVYIHTYIHTYVIMFKILQNIKI